jgi:hypothetical protein
MKIWHEDFSQEDLDIELARSIDPAIPLTLGRPLQGVVRVPLEVMLHYRRRRPAAFAAGPIVVVDERVKRELLSARTEIEFLDVEVKDTRTKENLPYYFANVLSELDCLDRDRSRYEAFKGFAQNIAILRLKAGSDSLDLFRLAGTLPPLLVASDQLANRITAVGRLGLRFDDVEEYRDPALL